MLVVYEGNGEIMVFEKKNEKKECAEYFISGGRNIDNYECSEAKESIHVMNSMRANKYDR